MIERDPVSLSKTNPDAGGKVVPDSQLRKLKRDRSTPENRKFWDGVEQAAATAPKIKVKEMADLRFPDDITMAAVRSEVMHARLKFPKSRFLLAALMEEVGELAQAILQGKDRDEIEKESIQVAALGIRICEEGDSSFDDADEESQQP